MMKELNPASAFALADPQKYLKVILVGCIFRQEGLELILSKSAAVIPTGDHH